MAASLYSVVFFCAGYLLISVVSGINTCCSSYIKISLVCIYHALKVTLLDIPRHDLKKKKNPHMRIGFLLQKNWTKMNMKIEHVHVGLFRYLKTCFKTFYNV